MKLRYRVEIYDANKANDLTIYSDTGVDKEYLSELVFSNLKRFHGEVKAYVFDRLKKQKTTALVLNNSIVDNYHSKIDDVDTKKEIKKILFG